MPKKWEKDVFSGFSLSKNHMYIDIVTTLLGQIVPKTDEFTCTVRGGNLYTCTLISMLV